MAASERIEIDVADGTKMAAYVARPDGDGPFPGVLVFQEVFGVTRHIRTMADWLAHEGFTAIAPEMFHRTAPGWEGKYDDIDTAMANRAKMTPEGTAADLKAAHAWLGKDKRTKSDHIGAVGFCMGGNLSFGANTMLPLQACVSYYGGGIDQSWLKDVAKLHGPTLLYWGLLDKHIGIETPRKISDALREVGKSFVAVEFSHADHGFMCADRASYNAEASKESWALTVAFLKLHLA